MIFWNRGLNIAALVKRAMEKNKLAAAPQPQLQLTTEQLRALVAELNAAMAKEAERRKLK